MNRAQVESRKKRFLEKMRNGDLTTSYETRIKRLKDESLYYDARKRVQ